MEEWVEVAKIFGTGGTAGAVMGLWIYDLVGQRAKLQDRNNQLTDHIQEQEEMNHEPKEITGTVRC